jgi:hypothetical protein
MEQAGDQTAATAVRAAWSSDEGFLRATSQLVRGRGCMGGPGFASNRAADPGRIASEGARGECGLATAGAEADPGGRVSQDSAE